jgi:IS30 family transposase
MSRHEIQVSVRRGRLDAIEIAEIERLALKRVPVGTIARRLNRKSSTINWHMITRGLINRKIVYRHRHADRRGRSPYLPEHDARLIELRQQGLGYLEIAQALTAEFGVPRNRHSVHNRNMMLAAYDGA